MDMEEEVHYEFFVLTSDDSPLCDVVLRHEFEATTEEAFGWFIGRSVPGELVFTVVEGESVPDLLFTSIASPIVSQPLIAALRDVGASGWDAFPVVIINCPDACPEHYGLVVHGRSGPIDDSLSVGEMRAVGDGPLQEVHVGLFFDQSTWDGSDVFAPCGSALIFVTRRVQERLEMQHLRGVAFMRQDTALNLSVAFLQRPL